MTVERPEKVICLDCGGWFHLLHWPHLRRRVALAELERQNVYTPRRAAQITGIPLQTIHSAIKRKALPAAQLGLLVSTDRGLVPGGERIINGITLENMLEFSKIHQPKYTPRR